MRGAVRYHRFRTAVTFGIGSTISLENSMGISDRYVASRIRPEHSWFAESASGQGPERQEWSSQHASLTLVDDELHTTFPLETWVVAGGQVWVLSAFESSAETRNAFERFRSAHERWSSDPNEPARSRAKVEAVGLLRERLTQTATPLGVPHYFVLKWCEQAFHHPPLLESAPQTSLAVELVF